MVRNILPEELVVYQEYIFSRLRRVCVFDRGFFYFPDPFPKDFLKNKKFYPVYLPREKKLLIPLLLNEKPVGVLVLEECTLGVDIEFLVEYLSLCLENISLKKSLELDELTELLNEQTFLKYLENNIKKIDELLTSHSSHILDHDDRTTLTNIALFVIGIENLKYLTESYGYEIKNKILRETAKTLKKTVPHELRIARIKNDLFGIIIPNYVPKLKHELLKLISRPQDLRVSEFNLVFKPNFKAGYFVYPQDVTTYFSGMSPFEKMNAILETACKCIEVAAELDIKMCRASELLELGGEITRVCRRGYEINLGKVEGIKIGDIFVVHSKHSFLSNKNNSSPKGEVIVVDVNRNKSLAEPLYTRPDDPPEVKDRLTLKKNKTYFNYQKKPSSDTIVDLKSFMSFFVEQKHNRFSLFIIGSNKENIKELFKEYNRKFPFMKDLKLTIGEYGTKSIIVYVPNLLEKDALKLAEKIYHLLKAQKHDPVIGIAYYPCLNFVKMDIVSNVKQAFEHASLLNFQKIAVFNTTTLTLKGDKLFRTGNYLSAIEEYRLALILDDTNTVARNSLAICYTMLGEYTKAKTEFEKCLSHDPNNVMILYNLGCLNMKMGEYGAAKIKFKKCLLVNKKHTFSMIRLAQIAEKRKEYKRARTLYNLALKTDNNQNLICRLLAELFIKQNNIEKAKQYLHKAVSFNPYDHKAFFLLGKIYMMEKTSKDLEIAISFLKRSIGLNPWEESYKKLLQKAQTKKNGQCRS